CPNIGVARTTEREAPAEGVLHRAAHVEIPRCAAHRDPGPARLGRYHLRQRALDHVGKLEILEEDIEEFLAREGEDEIVLARPVRRALPAATAAAPAGFLDPVAGPEMLVAGQDPLAPAALL